MNIEVSMSDHMYRDIEFLAKENMRSLKQEITYRLDQGMKMKKHLSENDTGILKLISSLYDREKKTREQ